VTKKFQNKEQRFKDVGAIKPFPSSQIALQTKLEGFSFKIFQAIT
jgi:hypothetical protein